MHDEVAVFEVGALSAVEGLPVLVDIGAAGLLVVDGLGVDPMARGRLGLDRRPADDR
jgi:hypothetical protein